MNMSVYCTQLISLKVFMKPNLLPVHACGLAATQAETLQMSGSTGEPFYISLYIYLFLVIIYNVFCCFIAYTIICCISFFTLICRAWLIPILGSKRLIYINTVTKCGYQTLVTKICNWGRDILRFNDQLYCVKWRQCTETVNFTSL